MKELNLEVGQKCWSIQLGDCVVVDTNIDDEYPIMCKSLSGENQIFYTIDGKFSYDGDDFYPSLFESNPFEPKFELNPFESKLVQENKAELINALCSVLDCPPLKASVKDIAKDKLQKLLESL